MQSIQAFYKELNKFTFLRKKGKKRIDYGARVSQSGIGETIKDSAKHLSFVLLMIMQEFLLMLELRPQKKSKDMQRYLYKT